MLLGVDLADDAGQLLRDVGRGDGVSDVRGGHLFREPNTGEPGWEMSRSSAPRMISAATETADYRYLFTLLGSELANNAIGHSLSGHPGGAYTHGSGLGVLQPDRASRPVRLEVVPPSRAQKVDVGAYGPGSKAVAHSHRSIPPYPWGGKVQVPGEPQTPTSNGYSWGVPSVVIRR